MSNDFPIWGCPWHGLIKGGELTTDAEHVIEFPQPAGVSAATTGFTALIDLEGAPSVDLPEPDDKGRVFLSQAILGAGQVHGITLPPGAWIYEAQPGENWLASIITSSGPFHGWPILGAGGGFLIVTLRLERFGAHGVPTVRTLSVPWPVTNRAIDAATPGGLGQGVWALSAVAPTGKRAAFAPWRVARDRHLPYCIVELELSGTLETGFTAQAQLAVSPAQAVAERVMQAPPITTEMENTSWRIMLDDEVRTEEVPGVCEGGIEKRRTTYAETAPRDSFNPLSRFPSIIEIKNSPSDHPVWGTINRLIGGTYTLTNERRGGLVGVTYSPEGELLPITVDLKEQTTFTVTEPSFQHLQDYVTHYKKRWNGRSCVEDYVSFDHGQSSWSAATQQVTELTVDCHVGDETVQLYAGTVTIDAQIDSTFYLGGSGVYQTSKSYSEGAAETSVSITDARGTRAFTHPLALTSTGLRPIYLVSVGASHKLDRALAFLLPGPEGEARFVGPVAAAPGMVAMLDYSFNSTDLSQATYPVAVAAPGLIEVQSLPEPGRWTLYGAWNPITGEAILAAEPVSYT